MSRALRSLAPAAALCAVLLAGGRAHAAWPHVLQEGKLGRWMFNLKLGAAPTIKGAGYCGDLFTGIGECRPTMFALVFDLGVSVDQRRNFYFLLPVPQFQVHNFVSIVMLPFGAQYDVPIRPAPGLYVSPRVELGYAAIIPNCAANCPTYNAGFVEVAVGAKLMLARRWIVGFEPFGLTIFFGEIPNSNQNFSAVSYRILWYGGVVF